MATAREYADWLRANQDQRGTQNYQTVLRAFQEARMEELQVKAAPEAPAAKPESGFMPALRAGATELGGGISALMGRVGLKDEAKAEAEYQAAKKRAAEIFKPTEEGWTGAPGTKFAELLGGSLPYMAAPLAAGAAAAALPLTGTAAVLTGLGAAGLTSAGQFTATNLSRQMEEGKKLADTDLGAAALAAIPQAALDTLSMRMIPGIGRIFGQAGVKITAENAKEIAEQGLKKTLIDYTAKTGKTAGIEGLTESAQQVFERLQAGLNITDEKARAEYFESFLGGAALGGTLAPAGRYVERGREQREARGLLEAEATKEREAQQAEEKAKKSQPDYILGVADQYEALNKQKSDLMAQIIKGTKEAPLSQEDKDRNVLIQQQLKELEPQLKEQRKEYLSLGGPDVVEKLREQKRIEAMTPEEYAEYSYAQRAVPGKPRAAAPETEEKLSADFADPLAVYEKGPSQPVLDYVAAQMRTAQRLDQGNFDVNDYAQFLIQDPAMAQRVVAERPAIPGVSEQESAAILDGLKLQLEALGGEMAAGREAAGVERTQAGLEQQVAREQAARLAATQQQLEFEGTAEREAMQEAAAARASDMRARELQPLQTAPQTALFPEVREGEVDTRPKGTLPERLNTLTERILAAPNVDDATKDLAQQVQGNLPQVVTQLRAQTEELAQRAPQRGVAPRVTPRGVPQGDEVAQIADWAQSVLQGRASPEMTADLRAAVQALQAGQRSETEQVTQYAGRALTAQEKQDVAGTSLEGRQGVMTREPTGEVRRAVQTEIAMPEPTAKAFESFGAFNDYLASEGLQAYRTQKGLVFPTLSNLQRRLAPIQTRVAELQAQLDDVNAKSEALQKADAAERGAASELLRESQQKLQATVKTLDETARTTYVGAKLKEVDLVELLDQAHGRLNASLAHSANLRQQFAQALGKIASAEEAAKPVMVDANGNATTKEKAAVRTVAQGQLPGYQALRKAQLDLQAKGNALVEADQKLEQVVKAGIGQSWETGSPTLTAYLKAKKVKDEAQRAAQQAHFAVLQAYRRVPSTEALNNNLSKFLAEKGSIDTEMARAAKSLSAVRLNVRNASNRLNDAYVRMENLPELRFGENLLRLRQDLLAAQSISEEAMGRSVERQAQAGELAKEAKGIAEPMRKQQALVRGVLEGAAERAEARRGVPAKETQADREARDADTRREEQARLERQEAIPATRVEFERAETDNQETRRLAEAVGEAPNAEARAAARKAFDEHLKALVARKDAELDDMKRKAAKNVQDLNTQRKAVAELTERLKGDLTPKRRESAEKQLAEAKRKLAEHERRYTLNTREMKIKRTDVQAQRQERNRLLAEANRSRVAGERLGVAEGTQQRALSPVTGAKTIPPKKMFTGSEESKVGATTTDTRQKLTEARGEKQRDVAINKKEQAEANRIAAELAKKTPEQKAQEQKEEEAVQKEQAKLQAKPAKVTPLRSEKATRRKGEVISESESVEDDFEPELLGGPEEDVFFRETGPQYESRDSTALNAATIEAVEDGDIRTALANLSENGSTPFVRELAKRLGDMTMRTKLEVRDQLAKDGKQIEGLYVASKNLVQLHRDALSEEVLTHELTHAATMRALEADPKTLTPEQRAARQEIENLHAAIQKQPEFAREYGRTDVKEFVSELMSNQAFRDKLDTKPGLLKRIYNALMRLIGFPRATMSEKAVENAYKLFMPSQAIQAAPAPSGAKAKSTFERWFGDSKVVDENGAPLVVYHGSDEVFDEFNTEEGAFFFGGKGAKSFAATYGDNVTEAYLSIKKPFKGMYADLTSANFDALAKKGYDGAVFTDPESGLQQWVAFRPEQIRPVSSPNIAFSRALSTANRVADNLIGKEKGVVQNLKDNFLGMGFRAQFVDKLAPLEEALKKGGIDQTKALQAMYYLRMYDQRMHFTSQAIADGVPEIVEKARKDGGTERLIETKPGANISQVVDILKNKDVVKAAGSADAANRLFTLYLAAIRAERVGINALNFGGKVTEADLKSARAEIEANPTLKNAFDEARDIYNQYNRNLIEFAVQTGALAKSEAKALLASNDYIPYYRMRDGVAQLIVGKETPIRIGNLKDSPHLKELVGGDEAIFDFLTSSVQNTAMLLDMSMKNLATKNTMFELRDVGLATVSKVPKSGKTPEGAVTFKRDGEDYFAVVDTDKIGIDSDLLVKGLAGIPTMFPSFVRLLGIPARFLRRVVVASPVYMARQLFRDSLAASMTSGADIVPVLDSLKQIGKPKALQNRGITGGQVFTGMPEDVTRMLKDMQAGKISVTSGLAWLEAKSAQADALTREAQYQSYRKQGLSEMEATYMALESMNFSKRGLSPTLHMVSTLIPFFNAQIQGLDVLYRAFTKQMPMNERLAIRDKLWTRGMLLAGMSVVYALAMQDEEAYKNAKPEEKYGNWFVPLESLGIKEPLRLPIPFELGYVFKALPEAIVNTLVNEKGGEEALKAGKHIVQQMIPGASSYFLPQAIKPALEALVFEKSLYTGRDIESAREKMSEPGFRYRDNTTELAREVGELTGFSPIKMEFLIRGYTGSMGMALLQALSAPFGSSGPEGPTKRMSDMPVVGTLFQPNDASGIIDATYERMKRVNQVKETYEGLLDKGRTADAQKYLADRTEEMALASVAGSFREYMGQITEFERNIRASSMTPEQKREKLDQARQMKIKIAESVRAVADRKTPQASPA